MQKLFNKKLKRFELLKIKNNATNKYKIFIHRNHSFEIIADVLNSFLNEFNIKLDFKYSSYDDSLNFSNEPDVDIHMLWLDLDRYKENTIKDFLDEKIFELSSNSKKPIILAYIGNLKDYRNDKAYIINVNSIIKDLKDEAYDLKKQIFSGTRLSSVALLQIAQFLGLKIIPSFFLPQIKAIITDLDNTFYNGILGEDGITNLVINKNYQNKLKSLLEKGYMISISSKNDENDVRKLFTIRNDFSLKYEDFTCCKINWRSKASNIQEIAKEMNIGLDSILFIDDNIAEIESIKNLLPQIHCILFENDENIIDILNLYPGFLKSKITREDLLRSKDIQANQERNKLIKNLSKEEYFRKLNLRIDITLNDYLNIDRIVELLNKTNQFILTYKRYKKNEILCISRDKKYSIITAKMQDRLSDSGIIAILICYIREGSIVVDELTISCRALGRNIEDIVVSKMLKIAKKYFLANNEVIFNYKKGQRNTPALTWLSNFCKTELKKEGQVVFLQKNDIKSFGLEIVTKCLEI